MEDLYYITPKSIGLEEIAKCAQDAGYTVQFHSTDLDSYLLIDFDCLFEGEPCSVYWRWNKLPVKNTSMMDETEAKRKKKLKPSSEFHITYPFFTIPAMLPFVQCLLDSYDGWIETNYDYEMYTSHNIEDLLAIDSDLAR